jgi:hypothetical protein
VRKLRFSLPVLILGVLIGCTSIPQSGPVETADVELGVVDVDFDFLPPGPSTGASPEEILAGFIAAGTAAQNNYRVARSYLTSEAAQDWNPNSSVLIRSGEPTLSSAAGNAITYTVPTVASVDEFGRYLATPVATDQELNFRFSREDDEWRISSLTDVVVLSVPAFQEAFSSYRLYYFSAGYRDLVADVRWFASRGEVSTKIVRSLLAKPSFWLDQGATVSAFPVGTQLALTPIVVTDGVARVDLTTQVLETNEVTRQRMMLQLTTSLAQVQGISSARISVNQNELVIDPLGEAGPTLASGRDSRLMVLRDRRFGYLQGGVVEVADGFSAEVAKLLPQDIFYSDAFGKAVLTRSDGVWVVERDQPARLLDERAGLVRAVVDSCGFTWSSTSESSPEMLQIINQSGQASTLPLDLGEEATLVSFELSRDNTRVLLLVQTETGVRVLLTAVARNEECAPESIGEFVELGPLSGTAVDAAWIDDQQVAVVVKDEQAGAGEAFVFDTSGRSESLGRPTRPQTLVGGVGGVSGLRLLSEDGMLYQPRGNGWQATGDRATALVTQR